MNKHTNTPIHSEKNPVLLEHFPNEELLHEIFAILNAKDAYSGLELTRMNRNVIEFLEDFEGVSVLEWSQKCVFIEFFNKKIEIFLDSDAFDYWWNIAA